MTRVDFDVIVIGSGAGGMATAVPLAQAGQKVLVLEQHYVPGGWTHSFTLQGYRFSPGVHYIGGIGPSGPMRRIYEGLGVSQDTSQWPAEMRRRMGARRAGSSRGETLRSERVN